MPALLNTLLSAGALCLAAAAVQAGTVKLDPAHTALVVTDPQNDFLAESGKLHGLLAENMKAVGTVENIGRLFAAAKQNDILVAVDPLVLAGADAGWSRPGALQRQLLDAKALQGEGGEIWDGFKAQIFDGRTLLVSPHKVYGPESNDLLYQLRARGVDTVVLAGLVANLCVDSHLRALMENGFAVYVVKDAVGAPGTEAYKAALVNYEMIANGVVTTDEAVRMLHR